MDKKKKSHKIKKKLIYEDDEEYDYIIRYEWIDVNFLLE